MGERQTYPWHRQEDGSWESDDGVWRAVPSYASMAMAPTGSSVASPAAWSLEVVGHDEPLVSTRRLGDAKDLAEGHQGMGLSVHRQLQEGREPILELEALERELQRKRGW